MQVQHQLSFSRLFSILLLPNLLLLLFGYLGMQEMKLDRWSIAFLISLLFYLPYVLIIINHWKYASGVVLLYDNKKVTLKNAGSVVSFQCNEITRIKEYTGFGRSDITANFQYWCIEVNGTKFLISFLTVSSLNFERMFLDKITEVKEVRWPSIKQHTC